MKQFIIFLSIFIAFVGSVASARGEARPAELLALDPGSRLADLYVLQIFEEYPIVGNDVTRQILTGAMALKGLSPAARGRIQYLLAKLSLLTGDPATANAAVADMGFLTDWQITGPFPNESSSGLSEKFLSSAYHTVQPEISPNCVPSEIDAPCVFPSGWLTRRLGKVTFESVFSATDNICVMAQTTVSSPRGGRHHLLFGAGGQARVFVNDTLILEDTNWYLADINRHDVPLDLPAGENLFTVKICSNESGTSEFFARILSPSGEPLHSVSPQTQGFRTYDRIRTALAPHRTLLDTLRSRPGKKTRPTQLGNYAEYAHLTGSIGKDTAVKDAAQTACEALGTLPACRTWASLADDVNEKRQAYRRVNADDASRSVAAMKLLLLSLDTRPDRENIVLLRKALKQNPSQPEARCALLGLYTHALPESARKLRNELSRPDTTPMEKQCAAESLVGTVADVYSMQIFTNAIESAYSNFSTHLRRLRITGEGMESRALAVLSLWKKIGAPPADLLTELLSLLMAAPGNTLEKTLMALLREAPGVSEFRKLAGEYYLKTNEALAIRHYREALQQNPGDKALRDLLEHLSPSESFDTPYLIGETELKNRKERCLQQRRDCYLVNNTITRVHASGLSSTVTQVAVAIATEDGARQWQQYSEQFSSDQSVRIQKARLYRADGRTLEATARGTFPVSEPWYRLYYDIDAEVIEVPKPEVGDVVEYQFRIDDIRRERMFGRYFGAIVPVNGDMPVEQFQFVLIRPADFTIRIEADFLAPPRVIKDDSTVTNVYTASNLPAIPDEPGIPGSMSLVKVIHATSWESFTDMERWYRELIRPQLQGGDAVQQLVRELTAKLKSRKQKIAAIYNWVTTNIRYVGLEFGIHGYKPYSTTRVIARGFGDCKDTASLLVAMLREAGINAHLALVRTRSAGELTVKYPSLALFNHAIAYLPEDDLWLDGTATFHGTGDLPFEDQGISALVIGTTDVALRKTPVTGETQSVFNESSLLRIEPDCSMKMTTDIIARGPLFAPWLRKNYSTAQNRDILEEQFTEKYPGLHVDRADFRFVNDLEAPPEIHFDASVASFCHLNRNVATFRLLPPLYLKRKYAQLKKRVHPLVLGPARTSSLTVQYVVPKEMIAKFPVGEAVMESEFGVYRRIVRATPEGATVTRSMIFRRQVVLPEQYDAFMDFVLKIDAMERRQITLHFRNERP